MKRVSKVSRIRWREWKEKVRKKVEHLKERFIVNEKVDEEEEWVNRIAINI